MAHSSTEDQRYALDFPPKKWHNVRMKFVPAGEVLADLERKASEYENTAATLPEPAATALRKLADLCRDWIKILTYGSWTS